jgi:hypothetical protein
VHFTAENGAGAKGEMGEGSEGIAAGGGGTSSCEAYHVGITRRKIAAAQKARWAKVKGQWKKAA